MEAQTKFNACKTVNYASSIVYISTDDFDSNFDLTSITPPLILGVDNQDLPNNESIAMLKTCLPEKKVSVSAINLERYISSENIKQQFLTDVYNCCNKAKTEKAHLNNLKARANKINTPMQRNSASKITCSFLICLCFVLVPFIAFGVAIGIDFLYNYLTSITPFKMSSGSLAVSCIVFLSFAILSALLIYIKFFKKPKELTSSDLENLVLKALTSYPMTKTRKFVTLLNFHRLSVEQQYEFLVILGSILHKSPLSFVLFLRGLEANDSFTSHFDDFCSVDLIAVKNKKLSEKQTENKEKIKNIITNFKQNVLKIEPRTDDDINTAKFEIQTFKKQNNLKEAVTAKKELATESQNEKKVNLFDTIPLDKKHNDLQAHNNSQQQEKTAYEKNLECDKHAHAKEILGLDKKTQFSVANNTPLSQQNLDIDTKMKDIKENKYEPIEKNESNLSVLNNNTTGKGLVEEEEQSNNDIKLQLSQSESDAKLQKDDAPQKAANPLQNAEVAEDKNEILEQQTQDEEFDFANSSTKDSIAFLQQHDIKKYDCKEIFEALLPKLFRMPEKNANELLVELNLLLKNFDISKTNFNIAENKAWQKLIDFCFATNDISTVKCLYQKSIVENNFPIVCLFINHLDENQLLELTKKLKEIATDFFEDDIFEPELATLIKLIIGKNSFYASDIFEELNQIVSSPFQLEEKPFFAKMFNSIILEISDFLTESQIEGIYSFLFKGLLFNHDGAIKSFVYSLIKLKEKFNFHGLPFNCNDILSNDKLSTDIKLYFIINSISSALPEEKTAFNEFVAENKTSFNFMQQIAMYDIMLKQGQNIEPDKIIDILFATKEIFETDFLFDFANLIVNFSNHKANKNYCIFADIIKSSLSSDAKVKILKSFFSNKTTFSAKLAKMIFEDIMEQNEKQPNSELNEIVLTSFYLSTNLVKFPLECFVDCISSILENAEDAKTLKEYLYMIALLYANMPLDADFQHNLKSSMFKGAGKFPEEDFALETNVILKIFNISYISFVEQKIARQSDKEVMQLVQKQLSLLDKERKKL